MDRWRCACQLGRLHGCLGRRCHLHIETSLRLCALSEVLTTLGAPCIREPTAHPRFVATLSGQLVLRVLMGTSPHVLRRWSRTRHVKLMRYV